MEMNVARQSAMYALPDGAMRTGALSTQLDLPVTLSRKRAVPYPAFAIDVKSLEVRGVPAVVAWEKAERLSPDVT